MRTDRRRTATRALFLIAAITYSGVPWEAAAGFPLDPSRSYLSELAAEDQPYTLVFRALDALTGALVLVALGLGVRTSKVGGLAKGAAVALAAFAVLTVLDASAPMACAPSTSARCAAADAANTLGTSHQVHVVSSAGALAAVVVSAVLLSIAVMRHGGRVQAADRRLVVVITGLLVAVTVAVSALAIMSKDGGSLVDGGGIVQRAQVLLVSAYIVAFGVVAGRLRPDAPPDGAVDSATDSSSARRAP